MLESRKKTVYLRFVFPDGDDCEVDGVVMEQM